MLPKIFATIAAAVMMFASATVHAESTAIDFVEGVDWQQNVVTAVGNGLVPPSAINRVQAEKFSESAARVDAYRKLAEFSNGVRVEGDLTIGRMSAEQDRVQVRVAATVKGAKIVSQNFSDDGSCRMIMQVPLFGVNSLAGAVFEPTAYTPEPFPNPIAGVAPSIIRYSSTTPLARRLELTAQNSYPTQETFTPAQNDKSPLSRVSTAVMGVTAEPQKRSVKDYADQAQGDFTGLIVDCRGLSLQPVMSPVIFNTNGTKIFGHKNIDPDKVAAQGMVNYAKSLDDASRAGTNPLVVKAVKLENFNSCPVLSLADSNRVLIENYATKFLNDLKVVFLFD